MEDSINVFSCRLQISKFSRYQNFKKVKIVSSKLILFIDGESNPPKKFGVSQAGLSIKA